MRLTFNLIIIVFLSLSHLVFGKSNSLSLSFSSDIKIDLSFSQVGFSSSILLQNEVFFADLVLKVDC